MPKSKGRRKGKKIAPIPSTRAQQQSAAPARDWRKRLGWPLAILGAVLFIAGNIGARTGFTLLPFDPHHVYAQFGGAAIGIVGLMWGLRS